MNTRNKANSNPKSFRLYEHPFVLDVMTNYQEHSKSISSQAIQAYQAGKKPEFSFTNEMAYHHNVFHYMNRLIDTIERIGQVPVFMRRFTNSKFFDENGISYYKWINYHYSNYLVMSVSLYDVSLLLTNEIFILRLKPRLCNERNVANNNKVKETSVKQSLDNLNQAINEYRDERNLFAHRGQAPKMGFMDTLESFEFIQKTEKNLGIETTTEFTDSPLLNPYTRKILFKQERRELIIQIQQKTDVFIDLILDLFSSQKPIYDFVTKQMNT